MELYDILLGIDILVMFILLFILLNPGGRFFKQSTSPDTSAVIAEFKRELKKVKNLSSRLESECGRLEIYKKEMQERQKRFDRVLKKLEEALDDMVSCEGVDNYTKALRMLRMGRSPDDVMKELKLNRGEVELITAISSLT